MPLPGVTCRAGPSLALIKYWGKRRRGINIPATASLAVTLAGLQTTTTARLTAKRDSLTVDGATLDPAGYTWLFDLIRRASATHTHFEVVADNDFPSSAGLASSSSGSAALVCACVRAAGADLSPARLSQLARVGSGSAARAIYGGFCLLPAGATRAYPLYDSSYWPQLRVLVAVTDRAPKAIGSRQAMHLTARTSSYYRAWLGRARRVIREALAALGHRDLPRLGMAMRQSYLGMFGTMLGCNPPLIYWNPSSVALIELCRRLRDRGLAAWETMDAGPQVKILTTEADAPQVDAALRQSGAALSIIAARIGPGPTVTTEHT